MRETTVYKVFGPFKVPPKGNGLLQFRAKAAKWEFWEQVVNQEEAGLSEACGCYVISDCQSRVWYVGKLAISMFAEECFGVGKPDKLNHANRRRWGRRLPAPRGSHNARGQQVCQVLRIGKKDIDQLESMLIMFSLRRNTRLLNKAKTKFIRSVVVPGVLNSQQEDERTEPVQSLMEAIGIGSAAPEARQDHRNRGSR